mmetsp:Transcript_9171/g.22564  ORF Transcript_9171/g.22564 Transcript_9171/m.22564 type:complete len:664 (-) Transcript_9171:210-2201(-)
MRREAGVEMPAMSLGRNGMSTMPSWTAMKRTMPPTPNTKPPAYRAFSLAAALALSPKELLSPASREGRSAAEFLLFSIMSSRLKLEVDRSDISPLDLMPPSSVKKVVRSSLLRASAISAWRALARSIGRSWPLITESLGFFWFFAFRRTSTSLACSHSGVAGSTTSSDSSEASSTGGGLGATTSFLRAGIGAVGTLSKRPFLTASVALAVKSAADSIGLELSMPSCLVRPMSSADFIASWSMAGSCIICISSGFAIILVASFWNFGFIITPKRLPLDLSRSAIISSIAPGSASRASAILANIGLLPSAFPTFSDLMSMPGMSRPDMSTMSMSAPICSTFSSVFSTSSSGFLLTEMMLSSSATALAMAFSFKDSLACAMLAAASSLAASSARISSESWVSRKVPISWFIAFNSISSMPSLSAPSSRVPFFGRRSASSDSALMDPSALNGCAIWMPHSLTYWGPFLRTAHASSSLNTSRMYRSSSWMASSILTLTPGSSASITFSTSSKAHLREPQNFPARRTVTVLDVARRISASPEMPYHVFSGSVTPFSVTGGPPPMPTPPIVGRAASRAAFALAKTSGSASPESSTSAAFGTGLVVGELGFGELDAVVSFTGSFLPLTEGLEGAILDFPSSPFFFFFASSGARRTIFPGEGGASRNAPPHR